MNICTQADKQPKDGAHARVLSFAQKHAHSTHIDTLTPHTETHS